MRLIHSKSDHLFSIVLRNHDYYPLTMACGPTYVICRLHSVNLVIAGRFRGQSEIPFLNALIMGLVLLNSDVGLPKKFQPGNLSTLRLVSSVQGGPTDRSRPITGNKSKKSIADGVNTPRAVYACIQTSIYLNTPQTGKFSNLFSPHIFKAF